MRQRLLCVLLSGCVVLALAPACDDEGDGDGDIDADADADGDADVDLTWDTVVPAGDGSGIMVAGPPTGIHSFC